MTHLLGRIDLVDQTTTLDQALLSSVRVFYQPVVRLTDSRTDYVEVLARTETVHGTIAGAASIVDAMTNSERSMNLTAGIMAYALAEYKKFAFARLSLCIAFNIPLDAMLHAELIQRIDEERSKAGVLPERIRFELTERHPVRDLEAVAAVVNRLRDAGYGLALDDVTPGMMNLPGLLAMPIRAIKLDRSVVVSAQKSDQAFVRTMAHAAASNGQDLIAEGIETAAACNRMRRLGVTHGQGYLFSRPLPAAELHAHLTG